MAITIINLIILSASNYQHKIIIIVSWDFLFQIHIEIVINISIVNIIAIKMLLRWLSRSTSTSQRRDRARLISIMWVFVINIIYFISIYPMTINIMTISINIYITAHIFDNCKVIDICGTPKEGGTGLQNLRECIQVGRGEYDVSVLYVIFMIYMIYIICVIYLIDMIWYNMIYDFKLQDDIIRSVFLVGGREVQLWTCEAEEAFLETDVHELHWEVNRLSILSISPRILTQIFLNWTLPPCSVSETK